jgi:hypothetical protein
MAEIPDTLLCPFNKLLVSAITFLKVTDVRTLVFSQEYSYNAFNL